MTRPPVPPFFERDRDRQAIEDCLTAKWKREFDFRLIKELCSFDGDRIALRFAFECHHAGGQWRREASGYTSAGRN